MSAAPRSQGPTRLSRLIKGAIDPVLAKRGFAAVDLIGAWDDIVGPRYAPHTRPERLKWPDRRDGGAVLTVEIDGAHAVFLQHEREQFIERINGFLGHGAIADIKLLQRPVGERRRHRPAPPGDDAPAATLDAAVSGVEDEQLRAALRRLAEGVVRARPNRR